MIYNIIYLRRVALKFGIYEVILKNQGILKKFPTEKLIFFLIYFLKIIKTSIVNV